MASFIKWFNENKIEVELDFTDRNKLQFLDELVEAEKVCEFIRIIYGEEYYPEILDNRIWQFCNEISKKYSKYGILSTCNLVDLKSLTYDLGAMLLNFIGSLEDEEVITKYKKALMSQLDRFEMIEFEDFKDKADTFKVVGKVIGEEDNELIAHYLDKCDDVVLGDRVINPFENFRGISEENDRFIGYFDKKISDKLNKPID